MSARRTGRPRRAAQVADVWIKYRLTADEAAILENRVARENAEVDADGGDGATATPNSYAREILLDHLGIAACGLTPGRKLDNAQRAEIRTRRGAGEGVRRLAAEYGVSPALVSRITRSAP